MERVAAESKLKHYHADHGDWVYTTTPEKARERAKNYRTEAMESELDDKPDRRLALLVKAAHFDAIADCLSVLGDDVPAAPGESTPSNVASFSSFKERKKAEADLDIVFVGEGKTFAREATDPDDDEPEFFTFQELKECEKPSFAIGDAAFLEDFGDAEFDPLGPKPPVVGYIPVVIVGMELYPDEIMYMFGFYEAEDDEILTNFETLPAEAFFKEIPEEKPKPQRPRLSIVR